MSQAEEADSEARSMMTAQGPLRSVCTKESDKEGKDGFSYLGNKQVQPWIMCFGVFAVFLVVAFEPSWYLFDTFVDVCEHSQHIR